MLDLGDSYPRFLPHGRGKSPKAEIGNISPLFQTAGGTTTTQYVFQPAWGEAKEAPGIAFC